MSNAVILAGGSGSKMWPYNEVRNKAMLPISNVPLIAHTVNALLKSDINDIYIYATTFVNEIKKTFRDLKQVHVIEIPETKGSAKTLEFHQVRTDEPFFLFFGDCLIQETDLINFIKSDVNTALADQVRDDPKNHIILLEKENNIDSFIGHPRGIRTGLKLFGLHLKANFLNYLTYTDSRFVNTKVGVSTPHEYFLESTLNHYLQEETIKIIQSKQPCFDLDKPWHIFEANYYSNQVLCEALNENILAENATISPLAKVKGYVKLGKNSIIGDNVLIAGNCIIGDNTIIDNGAIIGSNTIIGDNCIIRNNCKISDNCTVGNDSIVEFTAELDGGVLFRKVYLYHHCEFYGICGDNVDIGAGTVSGVLRFDDQNTVHQIKGRKEIPANGANATYLGDYVRTGVNVIFQPGVMVGTNSIVGSGTILLENVPSNKLVYAKQEIIEKDWGSGRYGW